MEKGNEGDEIILFSFRQIDCAIPSEVAKVSEINADLLTEILSRSLLLITDGEVQFPLALPQNIASRHRICTSIAAKIKELGYLNDCGYNQLLYPVESQTRDLLTWIVEKLPRSEEEGAEEMIGATGLMNRRILSALTEWKSKPRLLPVCSEGIVPRKAFESRPFTTIQGLLRDRKSTVGIFQVAAAEKSSVDSSVFEKHAHELAGDSMLTLRLERGFGDDRSGGAAAEMDEGGDGIEGGTAADGRGAEASGSARRTRQQSNGTAVARAAVRKAMGLPPSPSPLVTGAGVGAGTGSAGDDGVAAAESAGGADGALAAGAYDKIVQSKQIHSTLQELIQDISQKTPNAGAGTGSGSGMQRGTRFSHAVEFGQDGSAVAAAAVASVIQGRTTAAVNSGAAVVPRPPSSPDDPTRPMTTEVMAGAAFAAASGTGGGEGGGGGAEEGDASAAAAAAGGGVPGSGGGSAGGAKRMSQDQLEEQTRQEELEALRGEVQKQAGLVESITRQHAAASGKTAQFEAEAAALLLETEKMEKEVLMKRRTLELLPSARDNIGKLQDQCSRYSERLLALAEEWETHRQPLARQLQEKEDIQLKRREKGRMMVEEVKRYREEMAAMVLDLKDKQDKVQVLNEEKAKLNKNINRAVYTRRILDITAQIVKQNKDIDKITADIRDIQKTINQNSSTLQRADAITEELIFKAATDKEDPVMVDTYRRLKTLRAKFEELVEAVGRAGQQEKTQRDLETKIDQEQARVSAHNFDRIRADLDAITKENAQLISQIKSLSSAGSK